jgi:tRNA(fMet)-specific endonuclease VapC
MNGKFLLDTNIVIALFANDAKVTQNLQTALEIFLSITVLGELYYGAKNSARASQNLSTIHTFAKQVTLLSCDAVTAQYYGDIKSELRSKGQPIPENDIWIAATALQHNLTLVTRDNHFQSVTGLITDSWI